MGNRKRVLIEIAIAAICVAIFFLLHRTPTLSQRIQGDRNARSELRNASTAQEAYFVDNQRYTNSIDRLIGAEYGLYLSKGVEIYVISADKNHYEIVSFLKWGDKAYSITGPAGSIELIPKAEAVSMADVAKARIEGLFHEIKSKDSRIRANATGELAVIKDERVVGLLIEALKDEDDDVRWNAARALGIKKDKRAIKPLTRLLTDKDMDVRRAAAKALDRIQDSNEYQRLFGSEKLSSLSIERLADDLESNYPKVRARAAYGLRFRKIKDVARVVELLAKALKDEDKQVRKNAAYALGWIKDERAVKPLIEALRDRDSMVRSSAAQALGLIPDERAVESLIGLLKDKDKQVRKNAAYALGWIKDERAIGPLTDALKNDDHDVRRAAFHALRKVTRSSKKK